MDVQEIRKIEAYLRKLFGNARHSHIMSHVFDEGLALFAGLNVSPKRAFLTEYSTRIDPRCHPRLMQRWNFNVTVPLWDWVKGTIAQHKSHEL